MNNKELMESDLIKRLDALEFSKMINEKEKKMIISFVEYIKTSQNLEYQYESYSMVATHIAMIFYRIKNNETISKINDEAMQEIKDDINYYKAVKIVNFFEDNIYMNKISDIEKPYIYTHLLTLIGGNLK